MNILIVDDEDDILAICEATLEAEGHVVYLAADGHEAVQLLENQTVFNDAPEIDVVLTDWMMSKGSGIDLVKHIKKKGWNKIATILMSGKVSPEDLDSGLQIGVDEILVKPFDMEVLSRKVKSAYKKRKSHG